MRLFKWIGIAAAALILVVGALFLLVQTETVKNEISVRLSALLSTDPDWEIRLGKLSGQLPFDFRVAEVSISDKRGVWLEARDLVLQWSPQALLRGGIAVALLGAATVRLHRLPVAETAAEQEPAAVEPFALPESLPPVTIDRFRIGELILDREVAEHGAVFQVTGKLSPSPGEEGLTAALTAIRTDEGPPTRLELQVSLDGQPKELGVHATLHEEADGWLARVAGLEQAGVLSWSVAGKGPLAAWTGKVSGCAAAFGSLASALRLSVADPITLVLEGEGSANENLIPAQWQPLIGSAVRFRLELALQPDRKLIVRKASFEGKAGRLLLEGDLDLPTNALRANLEVSADNLTPLTGGDAAPSTAKQPPGTVRVQAQLAGDLQRLNLTAEIAGNLVPSADLPAAITSLLGVEVKLGTTVTLHEGSQLTVPTLTLTSPVFELTGTGSLDLAHRKLRGDLVLVIPDVAPLTALAGMSLAGSSRITGGFEGEFEAFTATVSASGQELVLDKLPLKRVVLDVTGRELPGTPRGELALVLHNPDGLLKLTCGYALSERELALSALSFAAPGSELSGHLRINRDSYLTEGELDGKLRDLALLGNFLQTSMTGSGTAAAVFATARGAQNVRLRVTGKNLSMPEMALTSASLAADLQNVFKLPRGTLDASLTGFQSAGLAVSSLTLKATGDQRELQFQGDAKGRAISPFEIQWRGRGLLSDSTQRLRLETFKGKAGPYSFALTQPLALERTGTGFSLEQLAMTFGKGNLAASGRLDPRNAQLNATFRALPLEAANLVGGPPMMGTAAGEIRVNGLPDRLQGEARVQLEGMRFAGATADLPPLIMTARTVVSGGRLDLNTALEGITEEPARAAVQVPVNYALSPFSLAPATRKPCQGELKVAADLARLFRIVPLDAQNLAGKLSVDLTLGGTLESPEIQGKVVLQDGLYENYLTGTVLKGMSLEAEATGERLEITRFQASDGGSGTIRAGGMVELDPAAYFPLEIRLTLSQATLVRRREVTGTAAGDLTLSGAANALKASGNLEVGPVEITLPERLPPEMTSVEVIEINRPEGTGLAEAEAPGASALPIILDIQSNLPSRIFVRGWGLDSEWQGKLHLGGTGSQPQVSGHISPVRGRVDFLNKRFDIVSGAIRFFGTTPPEPFLDLTAECKTREITALLILSGTSRNPKLSLQSEPPLPQDEVLARLLFGRGATEITPLQALRLAMVAKSLTVGGGRELDFISRTRELLGVDDLRFESSGNGVGQGSVGIGKYLTEGVYVDLQKGLGGDPDRASIEIELTPRLSLESEIRTDRSTGIGVNYRVDY